MIAGKISYLNNNLSYYKDGNGPKAILLFHGFGQDHLAFQPWFEPLRREYTVFSFDLFFHGSSIWATDRPFEKEDCREIMARFFKQEKIDRCELAGFSIGAKFVFAILELFPDRVTKVTLLAPDGVRVNFWYSLATGSAPMRALFKSMVLKPDRLNALLKMVKFLRMTDSRLLPFVQSQMDTEEKRNRVYGSWVYFRHLKFDMNEIISLTKTNKITLIVIASRNDKIIPLQDLESLTKHIEQNQVHIIETSHNNLIDKALEFIHVSG